MKVNLNCLRLANKKSIKSKSAEVLQKSLKACWLSYPELAAILIEYY